MNEKLLQDLKKKGRIRGYTNLPGKKSQNTVKISRKPKSKALEWMKVELDKWAKKHGSDVMAEHQFDKTRKFRWDFCFLEYRIALEFEGGIFLRKSGHNTATHYTKDCIKYNLGTTQGWRILRYTALNYRNCI